MLISLRPTLPEDYQAIFLQLGQTIKLLQGYLLLHPGSRSLFSIPCNMEVRACFLALSSHGGCAAPAHPPSPLPKQLLITCLTLPDHATSSLSESLAPPSPNLGASVLASPTLASMAFDFGLSSSLAVSSGRTSQDDGYADAQSASPTLAELTMETLLCALVDAPENTKLFEELGGVGEVVRLLRGKVEGGRAAK